MLLGSKNFILAKNWSQDPLFMVTSFLSILSTSSEFSTGHTFHLFKLIFYVVTSFVLLSEEKYQKNKKVKESKKTTTAQKQRKKIGAKVEQYLEEHIEKAKVSCVSVCYLFPCLCCSCYPPCLFITHLAPCYPPYLFVTHLALGTFQTNNKNKYFGL